VTMPATSVRLTLMAACVCCATWVKTNWLLELLISESALFAIEPAIEAEEIRDSEVIEKFHQIHHALREKLTLRQICERLYEEGDHGDEEYQLAQASVADFILLFKGLRGDDLSRHIDLCLHYGRLGGISDQQRLIVEKATAALQQIGRESRLNASRVRRFGVPI